MSMIVGFASPCSYITVTCGCQPAVQSCRFDDQRCQWEMMEYSTDRINWRPCTVEVEAPWTLPDPPEGRQWHRTDWTEEMLPDGYRPFLLGEIGDGQIFINGHWRWLSPAQINNPAEPQHCHQRTNRPLPPREKTQAEKDAESLSKSCPWVGAQGAIFRDGWTAALAYARTEGK